MSSISESKDIILRRVLEAFGPNAPSELLNFDGRIVLSNEKLNKRAVDAADSKWMRVTIPSMQREQYSIGAISNRRYSTTGAVYFQIFMPLNEGTKDVDTIAQYCIDIFEDVQLNNMQILGTNITDVGLDDKWYNKTIEIIFTYYDVK